MDILTETSALRCELAALAAAPEWSLLKRYDLLADKPAASGWDALYRGLRTVLAAVGVLPPRLTQYRWAAALAHAPAVADATPVLIWALGAERPDRARLRQACDGIARRLQGNPATAPVLVTDVADFAYFSRLGWLVEYVPELAGEGPSYQERKRRYLAWRYRDAVVLPVAVGLADEAAWQNVFGIVKR